MHLIRPMITPFLMLGLLFLQGASALALSPEPPDGIYKPTSLEAYVTLAGKRINLPLKSVRDALMREGWVVIRDRRIPIKKAKWELVLERMNFLEISGNASVTAPQNIVFHHPPSRSRSTFLGRMSSPMQVRMKGRYRWVPVTVTLQSSLNSTVKGDQFLIDSPLTINVIGVVTARGRIRLTATRKDITPPWRK